MRNVPVWQPDSVKTESKSSEIKSEPDTEAETTHIKSEAEEEKEDLLTGLSFSRFDLRKVLSQGQNLLAREGSELEARKISACLSKTERLARQRRHIDQVLSFRFTSFLFCIVIQDEEFKICLSQNETGSVTFFKSRNLIFSSRN